MSNELVLEKVMKYHDVKPTLCFDKEYEKLMHAITSNKLDPTNTFVVIRCESCGSAWVEGGCCCNTGYDSIYPLVLLDDEENTQLESEKTPMLTKRVSNWIADHTPECQH